VTSREHRLQEAAQTLGLTLDGNSSARLLSYLDLLARWNRTYNLTAVREPEQMLVQHLFDCLGVIEPLRRHGAAGRLLDVGSGGGLPGVVIAALQPELRVVCVDTVGKKAAFIRQAAAELKLPNLSGEHARVEALNAAPFDVITARAFSSLPLLVDLTRAHLKPGGVWMAMKGKAPSDEIAALPADIDVFHVEQLRIPDMDAERCIAWMRPRASAALPAAPTA